MSNESYIHRSAAGTVAYVGPDAIRLMQAVVLASSLDLYARSKILITRKASPTMLLRMAAALTKKEYKRGQYAQAALDVSKWADEMRAALPVVEGN